jgi:uncharacterized tellurite resistance protein B-like protein
MKNQDFKNFLFKSAVMAMACDGDIAETEIEEIRNIVANEIYFMGYDFEEPLLNNIDNIKKNGRVSINQYLQELGENNLSEHQEVLLIEVLLRVVEADSDVKVPEVKFLQMARARLKVDDETLILKFPNKLGYLLSIHDNDLQLEFTDDIKFE